MPNQFTGALPIEERFWSKAEKTEVPDGCWLWRGAHNKKGYGFFKGGGEHKQLYAHRVAYELTHGSIPHDMVVMHLCDNPSCVRPDHLALGTYADNSTDMVRKERQASGDRNGSRLYPERWARGERSGTATMTAAEVKELRALRASGFTYQQLMDKFGIAKTTVANIVLNRTWKHI